MMNIKTQRHTLIGITIALVVATCGVVAWSFSSLELSSSPATRRGGGAADELVPDSNSLPTLDDAIASRSLRGPLYDPPPPTPRPKPVPRPVPKPTPAPPPSLDFTLVGTIIQSAQSLAIIEDASGNFDIKGEGESLELTPRGITVQRVESEKVTLDWQGRMATVKLERSEASRKNVGRGSNRRRNRP